MDIKTLTNAFWSVDSEKRFNELAMTIFEYQSKHNPVYKEYISFIGQKKIQSLEDIPFIPIQFFKTHAVICEHKKAEQLFLSSATTGMQRSTHHVANVSLYQQSFTNAFKLFYGAPNDFIFLALLPSYVQQGDSSLIYMVDGLMKLSGDANNKFYNHDIDQLANDLKLLQSSNKQIFLIGVTYALLDLAEKHPMNLKNTIVLETGGMKGRRKEMVREELHSTLKTAFGVPAIHSEYGMTELLSQAYSKGDGIFETPPWMKILIRDVNDPLSYVDEEKTGGMNVIDLANIYSCSFIATQDLGKIKEDGSFEVLGRFDNSDIRGCNLLVGS